MRKKLSYEYVKNYIEVESKSGYTLISTDYVNNSKKLKMICDKGHDCEISYTNFQQGRRCNICGGTAKLSYEYIKSYIEKFDCLLLSDTYKNVKTMLSIQCPIGHIFPMVFYAFQSGNRCPECAKIQQSQNQLYSYDYVKNYIEVESKSGCELISQNYYGRDAELIVKCKCGEEFKTTFSKFKSQNKRQCNECGIKIRSDLKRLSYKEVYEVFKNNNCLLLSTTYNKNADLLHYICECGKESYISLNNFKAGQRCKECGDIRKRETLFKNKTAPSSTQQRYLHSLFGGELNYPINTLSLDIAFPEKRIYVEYDGSGHDLSVKHGNLTMAEFKEKELKRNYYLMRNGWKSIRIISSNDKLPSDETLFEMLDFSKQYLSLDHHYIKFDINNQNVITSQFVRPYDFGVLRTINREVA